METSPHKILDSLEQIWPPLAIVGAMLATGTKLWWADRQAIKRRVIAVEKIAANCVMKDDLIECRNDVEQTIEQKVIPQILQLGRDAIKRDQVNAIAHEKMLIAMNAGDSHHRSKRKS